MIASSTRLTPANGMEGIQRFGFCSRILVRSAALLGVAGRTEPDAKLTLNGREVALRDGRFDETITLVRGDNPVELYRRRPGRQRHDREVDGKARPGPAAIC